MRQARSSPFFDTADDNSGKQVLDQDAFKMIGFVLDDLRREAFEGCAMLLEANILPGHFDLLIACDFPCAFMAQTAFPCAVRSAFFQNLGVEHKDRNAQGCDGNDALGESDHIGCHTDTGGFMGVQCVQKISGDGQVFFACGSGRHGEKQAVMNERTDHHQDSFLKTGYREMRGIWVWGLTDSKMDAPEQHVRRVF